MACRPGDEMPSFRSRQVRVLAGLAGGSSLVVMLGAAASPSSAPAAGLAYRGVLNGVSALSRSNVWAVGDFNTAGGPKLVLRWNGSEWIKVASPDPHNTGKLNAVSARSASDAWAVGSYCASGCRTGSPRVGPLILRWNGKTWARVPAPQPRGAALTVLQGVSARSASDAWAVGYYCLGPTCYLGGPPSYPLILHWNGSTWTRAPSPDPGGRYGTRLNAVTALSASDAWAVGDYGINSSPTGQKSLVLHWNGTRWAKRHSPSRGVPPGSVLNGVSALSRSSAWAAGSSYINVADQQKTMVLRWRGTAWSQTASPSPGPNTGTIFTPLYGISALSPASAWAVGGRYVTSKGGSVVNGTLVLHWNGSRWRVVRSPSPGAFSVLNAASGLSHSSVWAVGMADG